MTGLVRGYLQWTPSIGAQTGPVEIATRSLSLLPQNPIAGHDREFQEACLLQPLSFNSLRKQDQPPPILMVSALSLAPRHGHVVGVEAPIVPFQARVSASWIWDVSLADPVVVHGCNTHVKIVSDAMGTVPC